MDRRECSRSLTKNCQDWNLEKKMHLIRSAYDALPPRGALVAIEALIDDARRVTRVAPGMVVEAETTGKA
jgi:hypothetical protein